MLQASLLDIRMNDTARPKSKTVKTGLLAPRRVGIPAKDWDAFNVWARRPPMHIPALAELARRKPSWQS